MGRIQKEKLEETHITKSEISNKSQDACKEYSYWN